MRFFSGEEGDEDVAEDLRGDALAIIGDSDADAVPACRVCGIARAQKKAASGRHSVDGIRDEVIEDLVNLAGEALNRRGICQMFLDGDAGRGEACAVETEDGLEELFGGSEAGFVGLAVKAEGLGGDLGDAG